MIMKKKIALVIFLLLVSVLSALIIYGLFTYVLTYQEWYSFLTRHKALIYSIIFYFVFVISFFISVFIVVKLACNRVDSKITNA